MSNESMLAGIKSPAGAFQMDMHLNSHRNSYAKGYMQFHPRELNADNVDVRPTICCFRSQHARKLLFWRTI